MLMFKFILAFFATTLCLAPHLAAQDLRVATVSRPPFSMQDSDQETGFSIDLWDAVMTDMDRTYEVIRVDEFGEMLDMVLSGLADAAIANISITASRELVMDFSQPIFTSGLQIMIPPDGVTPPSIWSAILSRDLLLAVVAAFALLIGGGMLMWRFERNSQPYFDKPAREAMFPAFWWALNLIVNGGFEERVPRSFFGRIFGVFLVISSLFFVSVFVAKITSVMTVNAIQSSVATVSDLEGKRVGTTAGSTASNFLANRGIQHQKFDTFETLIADFEHDNIDAVVFDAPVLAYYVSTVGRNHGTLVGPIFMRDNYGIALATGSALAEPINQSLLRLREDGTYDAIHRKWFGLSAN